MNKKPRIVDAIITSPDCLQINVNLDRVHVQFSTGKLGFSGSDFLEWNGKPWTVRFQAFIRSGESPTTHGLLQNDHDHEPTVNAPELDAQNPLAHFKEHFKKERERREAGWSIHSVSCGLSALCVLSVAVRPNDSGGFASCYFRHGDQLYLGQFFIKERIGQSVKPTSWDWSKGAKAGLPSLGKRR